MASTVSSLTVTSCNGSTAISSIEAHHLPHENTYVLKPYLRGLAKRMIHRLVQYQTLDGFAAHDLHQILDAMIDLYKPAPAFIHMTAPVVIFGDTHGQFADLLRMIMQVGPPPKSRFLFLGDYCDRGRKSIEILILLFCYKLLYPTHVQILRGNHECAKMNRIYGFYEECRRSYDLSMYKHFQVVFNELPLCCLVANKIICMHGGISPDIKGMETLYKLKKPRTIAEGDVGVALDLMWSDPGAGADSCCSYMFNKTRNASWIFGTETIKDFIRLLNIDMIVRAHETCRAGHQFHADKLLCTVFSAPNYCGQDGNSASIMKVSADLKYSFVTWRPELDKRTLSKEKLVELEKQSKNADIKSPNPNGHKTAAPDKTHLEHEKSNSTASTQSSVTSETTGTITMNSTQAATSSGSNSSIISSFSSTFSSGSSDFTGASSDISLSASTTSTTGTTRDSLARGGTTTASTSASEITNTTTQSTG